MKTLAATELEIMERLVLSEKYGDGKLLVPFLIYEMHYSYESTVIEAVRRLVKQKVLRYQYTTIVRR